MWLVQQPDFSKATKEDIEILVKLGVITEDEVAAIVGVISSYHSKRGEIDKTIQATLSTETLNSLHKGYKDGLMYKNGDMSSVATDLYKNVGVCPYCGCGAPESLDHFKHKDKWKSLSLCRLNLVPVCWACNRAKGTKDSALFIHPYYTQLPNEVFLNAKFRKDGDGYAFDFNFDASVFNDLSLYGKLMSHWSKLDLNSRLMSSVTSFLCSAVIVDCDNLEALKEYLPSVLYITQKREGRNHWRTAVVRECIEQTNGLDAQTFFDIINKPENMARDRVV